ncbi:MAG TPA: universal stress protein [Roseiarcus sp.]|nr:universal stress protein [Roseiarcus sp.]
MTFATVMACLDVDRSNANLLGVVGAVARRFGSRVIGVAARQASGHFVQARAGGLSEPLEHDTRKFRDLAGQAEAEFRAALGDVARLEWRRIFTAGPVHEQIADEARSADLVVSTIEGDGRFFFPSGQAAVGDLLMRLGRPVLAAPPEASTLEFKEAFVCWKDTREARRAVADALPALKASERVTVIEIVKAADELDRARRGLADLSDWLAIHEVPATCMAEIGSGTEAQQLAAIAKDLKADVVVAGAFGHSRLREWAFGGVTSDLLLRADCCVLASH